MEGGFEPLRGTGRPLPGFEPPVEPGGGPSARSLALVARIMRGRELAADAAGIPPLDSDQVLDLQRSAGNTLTTGALARWMAPAPRGPIDGADGAELLERLVAARVTGDEREHAAAAARIDALAPVLRVRLTCTEGPAALVELAVRGPVGGAAFDPVTLAAGVTAAAEVPFAIAFAGAAAVQPGHGLALFVHTDAGDATLLLPLPFAAPAAAAVGATRFVALAEVA